MLILHYSFVCIGKYNICSHLTKKVVAIVIYKKSATPTVQCIVLSAGVKTMILSLKEFVDYTYYSLMIVI